MVKRTFDRTRALSDSGRKENCTNSGFSPLSRLSLTYFWFGTSHLSTFLRTLSLKLVPSLPPEPYPLRRTLPLTPRRESSVLRNKLLTVSGKLSHTSPTTDRGHSFCQQDRSPPHDPFPQGPLIGQLSRVFVNNPWMTDFTFPCVFLLNS